MNAAAGMKAASISASPRRFNQLPVSFSFVTPCVSPFSLNHSSERFDSCRLRRGTSYSSHLPIDFSLFTIPRIPSFVSIAQKSKKEITRLFVVSDVIFRSRFREVNRISTMKRNGSIEFRTEPSLVKYASSRGIDFSVTLQSVSQESSKKLWKKNMK